MWCQKAVKSEGQTAQFLAYSRLINLLFAARELVYAKEEASKLLAKASSEPQKFGYALHVSNIVLGKIALIEGYPTIAAGHLLASADISDSEWILSTSIDMSLARELFKTGDLKTVSSFLDRCENFGFSHSLQRTIGLWRKALEAGDRPPEGA